MFARVLALCLLLSPAALAAPPAAPPIDGAYGAYTQARVVAFQRARGLKGDGVAGYKTQHALGMRYFQTLRPGDRGPRVAVLQRALEHRGWWRARAAASPRPAPSEAGWVSPPLLVTPRPDPLATPDPAASDEAL